MSNIVTMRRRPTGYSQAAADRVCDAVAGSSLGLKKLTEMDGTLPREGTIYQWKKLHPEFKAAFEAARERMADMLVGECVQIADDRDKDVLERATRDGGWELVGNPTNVARAKLMIDTRLAVAGRLAPRAASKAVAAKPVNQGAPFVLPDDLSDLIC